MGLFRLTDRQVTLQMEPPVLNSSNESGFNSGCPPPTPTNSNRESIFVSFYPEWVVALCIRAMNGWNEGIPDNYLGCDENGDLVIYRKLVTADYASFPNLGAIEEIWLTYELPESN